MTKPQIGSAAPEVRLTWASSASPLPLRAIRAVALPLLAAVLGSPSLAKLDAYVVDTVVGRRTARWRKLIERAALRLRTSQRTSDAEEAIVTATASGEGSIRCALALIGHRLRVCDRNPAVLDSGLSGSITRLAEPASV